MITGNGVTTTYTYDPSTRRLSDLVAGKNQNQPFQNLHYSFDPVGNITALSNSVGIPNANNGEIGGPMTASYQYDDLYRLISAGANYRQNIGWAILGSKLWSQPLR